MPPPPPPPLLPPPPPGGRTSIKLAKASFKSRHTAAPLTERARRQLERADELERRAARAREADRRRVEAAQRLSESDRRERERERQAAMLGSQRRCDRFGYKSSQMHLGAFFGGGGAGGGKGLSGARDGTARASGVEDADGAADEFDDEALLDALDEFAAINVDHILPRASSVPGREVGDHQAVQAIGDRRLDGHATAIDDLDDIWADFDSGSQIARELEAGPKPDSKKSDSCLSSPDLGSFDISVEEINDAIQSRQQSVVQAEQERKLMPPPALPLKRAFQPTEIRDGPATHLLGGGFLDLSCSQLESFIDDDLQLTQVG